MKTSTLVLERPLSWRQWLLFGMLVGGILGLSVWSSVRELGPSQLIEAARRGSHRELAKLLLVTERYRDSDAKVIYNGTEYAIPSVLGKLRGLLATAYHGEAAETWVNLYLHRSQDKGDVIYLQYPDGMRRPLRDVFLEELRRPSSK